MPEDEYYAPESIVLWKEDDWWIIKHEETGVTTQGKTKLHAILMIADAIAAYNDSDEDLVELSEEVFELSDEQKEFLDSLEGDIDY